MSDRLDRVESLLEQLIQAQVNTQQQIASNARAIEANSNSIVELQELKSSIEDVVSMVGSLGQSIELVARQAEQDRLEFRSTVRSLLEALTQRFSGNGHG